MKTPANRIPAKATPRYANSPVAPCSDDFFPLTSLEPTVKMETCFDFARSISQTLTPDDIARFGRKASYFADSLGLLTVTVTNPRLGPVRVYSVDLLKWVYQEMAPQFSWPTETLALEDVDREKAETLRKAEREEKMLQEMGMNTNDIQALNSIQVLREKVQATIIRLRNELTK